LEDRDKEELERARAAREEALRRMEKRQRREYEVWLVKMRRYEEE